MNDFMAKRFPEQHRRCELEQHLPANADGDCPYCGVIVGPASEVRRLEIVITAALDAIGDDDIDGAATILRTALRERANV